MSAARFVSYPFVDFFFKVLNRAKAIGQENIPKKGGVIIASNHISGIDTLLIPLMSAQRLSTMPYVAPGKEELFKIPLIGQIIKLWGSFPVKRRAHDYQSMNRMIYYGKHYNMMLFPEGTRSKTGELLKGRSGAGRVIYMSKPTVIPTLVINTQQFFWPGRKRPWFFVPYRVVFGEPLNLEKYYEMEDSKKTSQALINEVMKAIADLREKHKDLYLD